MPYIASISVRFSFHFFHTSFLDKRGQDLLYSMVVPDLILFGWLGMAADGSGRLFPYSWFVAQVYPLDPFWLSASLMLRFSTLAF